MDKVPCREEGMTPYEMMLSESQERMLMVLKPGKEAMAAAIFEKWELDFAVIGEVTDVEADGGHMVLTFEGEVVCDIPLGPLAADAPEYERPYLSKEDYKAWAKVKPLEDVPESTDIGADLLKLMASPALASKRWISEQYDSQVMGDTLQTGGDAGVVRVHGTNKALAITTDCTPRYVYADPYEGGKQAIAEAYRNLCAVGARPLAVTNCLNFANPERPEIMAQFVHALEGMGDACRALDFPIVSGNVSLYNESKATGGGSAILPTPAIGGVGIIDDYSKMMTMGFKEEGEQILLIGDASWPFLTEQSLWLRELHDLAEGQPPCVGLSQERLYGEFVQDLVDKGLVSAVHDVSDGGIATALAEMALAGDHGFDITWDIETANYWFGEHQSCYIVTGDFSDICAARPAQPAGQELMVTPIGQTGGDQLKLPGTSVPLTDLRAAHESFFKDWMEG
jgi:phosphoribosylformylglycinamidine synthase